MPFFILAINKKYWVVLKNYYSLHADEKRKQRDVYGDTLKKYWAWFSIFGCFFLGIFLAIFIFYSIESIRIKKELEISQKNQEIDDLNNQIKDLEDINSVYEDMENQNKSDFDVFKQNISKIISKKISEKDSGYNTRILNRQLLSRLNSADDFSDISEVLFLMTDNNTRAGNILFIFDEFKKYSLDRYRTRIPITFPVSISEKENSLSGFFVSSGYGNRNSPFSSHGGPSYLHPAYDIAPKNILNIGSDGVVYDRNFAADSNILVAYDGTVLKMNTHYIYGKNIEIRHEITNDLKRFFGRGKVFWTTFYAHLKDLPNWNVGDSVKQGDFISLMGNTGQSTGPHLHFEVRLYKEDMTFDNFNPFFR